MRVVATVRKRGRRVSLVDVELRQGARTGDVGAPPACGDARAKSKESRSARR
jgi:hypothetical protein